MAISAAEEEKMVLASIKKAEGPVGNQAMMNRLGWSKPRYWKVRTRLVERGKLIIGAGRGGSVRRA